MDLCNTVIKGAEPYSDLHVACHACRSLLLLVEEKFPPEAASKAEFKNVLKHTGALFTFWLPRLHFS